MDYQAHLIEYSQVNGRKESFSSYFSVSVAPFLRLYKLHKYLQVDSGWPCLNPPCYALLLQRLMNPIRVSAPSNPSLDLTSSVSK